MSVVVYGVMAVEEKNQDMFKMFEQAMAMSKLFQSKEDASGEQVGEKTEGDHGNTDPFKRAMDMMQFFNMMNQTGPKTDTPASQKTPGTSADDAKPRHSRAKPSPTTAYFDDSIHTPALKSIKSAIPYLEYKYQKNLGIWVKLVELQKLMEMYSHQAVSMQGTEQGRDWRRGMLQAIRPHMEEEKQYQIDMLLKCLDMRDIMSMMHSTAT